MLNHYSPPALFYRLVIVFSSLSIRTASITQPVTTVRSARVVSLATTVLTDRQCHAPVVPAHWGSHPTSQYIYTLFLRSSFTIAPLISQWIVYRDNSLFFALCVVLQRVVCRKPTGCSVCVCRVMLDHTVKGKQPPQHSVALLWTVL